MSDNSRSPRDAAKLGGDERAGHDLIGDRVEDRDADEPVKRVSRETRDSDGSAEEVTRTARGTRSSSEGTAERSRRSVPASEVPGNTSETNPTGDAPQEPASEPGTGFPFPEVTGTGSGRARSPLGPGGCAKPAASMFILSMTAIAFAIRKSRLF